jgi:hypothetical protein
MCVMSMVHDYFQQHTVPAQWNPEAVQAFERVAKMLDELDKMLGQKECFDPFKAVWFENIKAELEKLRPQMQLPFTYTTIVPAVGGAGGGVTAHPWGGNVLFNTGELVSVTPTAVSGAGGGTPTRGAGGELAQQRLATGCAAAEEERYGKF